ncbi:MAG: hypothetical protein Q9168_006261 [Polycauliona sp. 1 TL-2023]
MTTPFICARCRYTLLRLAQQTTRRGFISLSQSSGQANTRQPDNALPTSEHGGDARPGSRQRKNAIKRAPNGINRANSVMDSVLEQLFTSSLKSQSPQTKTRYSGTTIPRAKPEIHSSPQRRNADAVETLTNQFYKDKVPLQEVWKNLERVLFSEFHTGKTYKQQRPKHHRTERLFKDVLMAINQNYLLSVGGDGLPPAHKVIDLYAERAVMHYWWNNVLWPQLAGLLHTLEAMNAPQQELKRFAAEERVVLLMQETMNVWSSFIYRYALPDQSGFGLENVASPPTCNHAWFKALLPKHPESLADQRIVGACKLTHQILKEITDIRRLAIPMTDLARTFVSFLNKFIEGRTFSLVAVHRALTYEGVQPEIIDRWLLYTNGWGTKPTVYESSPLPSEATTLASELPSNGSKLIEQNHSTLASLELQEKYIKKSIQAISLSLRKEHKTPHDDASRYRAATTIIKDMERAVDRLDVARVGGIWQEFQRLVSTQDIKQQSREEIYIQFLSSFIALSRQEQAVHVWNQMLQSGVTPNQRHWNAMLHGASKARDVISVDEIWSGMLATGIEPDLVSWTTYISGLIKCKKDQRGLQALNDLGRIWKKNEKVQGSTKQPKDASATESHSTLAQHNATRPSLAPVQAALGALLRIGKEELCWPLMEWAKSFSIPLTIGFLNVMLRHAVRRGDAQLINRIFSTMDANKCSADEQTYTIMLNGHMSNINSTFPDLSPQEQEASVLRILDDMTAKNVAIDQRTYGTILYGLLNPKTSKRNDQAARAVLDHMEKHHIKPSYHINSILVSHYFSKSPPDLQAVESLWKRIKIERPILDREFYEKLVEGYAAARLVERMLYFLRRIPYEGKCPTWDCLNVVLDTLIHVGEWGLVKELITDVKDRKTGLRRFADQGWKGGRSEEGFWVAVENVSHRIEEQG